MKRYVLLVLLAFGVILSARPAAAGGWAVSSLDEVPSPAAGVPVRVGFVIRQHGVTPVNPDGEVGIAVTAAGRSTFYAATSEGAVGHYVADVTFPSAGSATWEIRQGWFAPQKLGTIEVAAATGAVAARADRAERDYRWPAWLRTVLPLLALGCAAGAIATRRAPRRVVA